MVTFRASTKAELGLEQLEFQFLNFKLKESVIFLHPQPLNASNTYCVYLQQIYNI